MGNFLRVKYARGTQVRVWVINFMSDMLGRTQVTVTSLGNSFCVRNAMGYPGDILAYSIYVRITRGHPGVTLGYTFHVRNVRGHLGDILGYSFHLEMLEGTQVAFSLFQKW